MPETSAAPAPTDGQPPAAAPAPVAVTAAAVQAAAPAPTAAAAPAPAAPAAVPAPVEYKAFTLPDGVALDAGIEGELKTVAADLKLSQENAQRFVNLGAKMAQKFSTDQSAAVAKAKTDWAAQAKADQEIGGDKFDSNVSMANNVFREFGTPELKKLLDESGIGNHPEMLRWARRVATAMGENRFVAGRPPAAPVGADRDEQIANKLYGKTTPISSAAA